MSNYIATGGLLSGGFGFGGLVVKPPTPVSPGSPAPVAPIPVQESGSRLPLYIGVGAAVIAGGVFLYLRRKKHR